MFIQTEATPNPATLKFLPGETVVQNGPFEFVSAEEATDRSPLAERLFSIPSVTGVFFGFDSRSGSLRVGVSRFREQIQMGGPVTVTDPRIIRYFMTIPEAAQLVIQAGAMGKGGDVFVLDMGEPVKIVDLARRMIHLSGFEIRDDDNPDGDVEIVFTGLRPGEKLYEELLIGDNVSSTEHPLIMSAREDCLTWERVTDFLRQLEESVVSNNVEQSRNLLIDSISDFKPQCGVADLVREETSPEDNIQNNVIKYPGLGD